MKKYHFFFNLKEKIPLCSWIFLINSFRFNVDSKNIINPTVWRRFVSPAISFRLAWFYSKERNSLAIVNCRWYPANVAVVSSALVRIIFVNFFYPIFLSENFLEARKKSRELPNHFWPNSERICHFYAGAIFQR